MQSKFAPAEGVTPPAEVRPDAWVRVSFAHTRSSETPRVHHAARRRADNVGRRWPAARHEIDAAHAIAPGVVAAVTLSSPPTSLRPCCLPLGSVEEIVGRQKAPPPIVRRVMAGALRAGPLALDGKGPTRGRRRGVKSPLGLSTMPTTACPPACTSTCSTVTFCWPSFFSRNRASKACRRGAGGCCNATNSSDNVPGGQGVVGIGVGIHRWSAADGQQRVTKSTLLTQSPQASASARVRRHRPS
jgi:hypothetical protein